MPMQELNLHIEQSSIPSEPNHNISLKNQTSTSEPKKGSYERLNSHQPETNFLFFYTIVNQPNKMKKNMNPTKTE